MNAVFAMPRMSARARFAQLQVLAMAQDPRILAAGAVVALSLMGAHAEASSFASLFQGLTNLTNNFTTWLKIIIGAVGFCFIIAGCYDLYKMSKDDNRDASPKSMALKFIAGVFMAGAAAVMQMAAGDVGITITAP